MKSAIVEKKINGKTRAIFQKKKIFKVPLFFFFKIIKWMYIFAQTNEVGHKKKCI